MPERVRPSKTFGLVIIALLSVITAMSAGLLLMSLNVSQTLDAQRQSSARSECRTSIVNEDEDVFRHAVGDLAAAAETKDAARIDEIVTAIRTRVKTQDRIEKLCPAALVSTTTTEAP